jgi:hypothetical protein
MRRPHENSAGLTFTRPLVTTVVMLAEAYPDNVKQAPGPGSTPASESHAT